ncbi:MAG: hypothetical protein EOP11_15985, partial [Proteobacteria bacterium]
MIAYVLLMALGMACQAAPETFLKDLDAFKEKSPAIRTQAARLNAASYRALNRWLQFTPDLSASVSKNERRTRANVSSNELNIVNTQDSTDLLSIGGRFNLFRGGGDLRAAEGASLAKEAQKLLVANENLNVELEGAKLIFGSLYLKEALDAQREQLRLREEAFRIGRERYKQGKIPLQEVTTVEVDLADQRTELRAAELQLEENAANLKALFVDQFQTTDWPFKTNQQLNLGDERSPLLQSLSLQAEAARKNEQAARLGHMPSLDLSLQYQLYPLRSLDNREWLGSLSFTLPIWNRFDTVATTAEAAANRAEADAQAQIREREEGLRRSFLTRKVALSAENVEEARKDVDRSEGLYQAMLRSFQLGRLSANELQ